MVESRGDWFAKVRGFAALVACLAGAACSGPIIRPQSPDPDDAVDDVSVRLIGDSTAPFGFDSMQVESVGLVKRLRGDGGDPDVGPLRGIILRDMQRRDVRYPNAELQSSDSAMVQVRAVLRPGIKAGERFDVEVKAPPEAHAVSLRGGYLLESDLTDVAILGGRWAEGRRWARAKGPVLIDPTAGKEDDAGRTQRGRILGGGIALKDRAMGLVIFENPSIVLSQRIGGAINQRFNMTNRSGIRVPVATPKTPEYIELVVHPRYEDNVARYVRVVRSIAVAERPLERAKRLESLERRLLDPVSAQGAALQLEAIGEEAIPTLKAGLVSSDPEVRFYSAEALAYLDQSEAAPVLALIARDDRGFRAHALAALSAMDSASAFEELRMLLTAKSVETRYGAFRSLWAMDSNDSLTRGQWQGQEFCLHELPQLPGEPLVHVTRSYRPEVVLFGAVPRLKTPLLLEAGKEIVIRSDDAGRLVVSRFSLYKDDIDDHSPIDRLEVDADVASVVRAIAEVGGRYPDVLEALNSAKQKGYLTCRFEIDALPDPGRSHAADPNLELEAKDAEEGSRRKAAGPTPELFASAAPSS